MKKELNNLIKSLISLILSVVLLFTFTYAWFTMGGNKFQTFALNVIDIPEHDPFNLYYLADKDGNIVKNEENLYIISNAGKDIDPGSYQNKRYSKDYQYKNFYDNELYLDDFKPDDSITVKIQFDITPENSNSIAVDFINTFTYIQNDLEEWILPENDNKFYLNKAFKIKLMHDFKGHLTGNPNINNTSLNNTDKEKALESIPFNFFSYKSGEPQKNTNVNSNTNVNDAYVGISPDLITALNDWYYSHVSTDSGWKRYQGTQFYSSSNPGTFNFISSLNPSKLDVYGSTLELAFNLTYDETYFSDLLLDGRIASNTLFPKMRLIINQIKVRQ